MASFNFLEPSLIKRIMTPTVYKVNMEFDLELKVKGTSGDGAHLKIWFLQNS